MATHRETREAHTGCLFVPVWAALANEENDKKENKNMFFFTSLRDVGKDGDAGYYRHHREHEGERGYHEERPFVSACRTKKTFQGS